MAVFITILAVLAFVVGTNKKARAWLTTKGSSTGFTDPRILITIGLIIFNLISWKMIPWWWDVLTFTWYHFAFFNLGFWTVLYLRTIKTKDKKDEETKEDHPTASKMASVIVLVLVVGLLTTAWYKIQQGDLTREGYQKKITTEKALAKEPVIAVVASCLPKEFDTTEKVEAASKLYREKGLLPWLNSSGCWGVKLNVPEVNLAIFKAPKDEFGEIIKTPTMWGYKIFWDSPQNYEVMVNEFQEFFVQKGEEMEGTINSTRFRGIGEPATIRVWLTKH